MTNSKMSSDTAKKLDVCKVCRGADERVENDMVLGVGSGSTICCWPFKRRYWQWKNKRYMHPEKLLTTKIITKNGSKLDEHEINPVIGCGIDRIDEVD